MTMQFEGPAADSLYPAGRAPQRHSGRYIVSGMLLLAYAGGLIAWIVYAMRDGRQSVADLAQGLVDPAQPVAAAYLSPYEWILTLALIAVGVLALLRRRLARGGALVLGVILVGLAVRDGIAIGLDSGYRESFTEHRIGEWYLSTFGAALIVGAVVVFLMARATEDPGEGVAARRWPLAVGGALLLVYAAAAIGWKVWELRQDPGYAAPDTDLRFTKNVPFLPNGVEEFFRAIGYPTGRQDPSVLAPYYHQAAIVLALLAVGVIALYGRRWARGAMLVLSGVLLYLMARIAVLWSTYDSNLDATRVPSWTDIAFDNTTEILRTATYLFGALAAVTVIVLALAFRDRSADSSSSATSATSATSASDGDTQTFSPLL
ncbi:hypothetical protein G5C51_13845 [Streptomyces sp. A7024]|uniref:Uncharacterized protein n=1 Tax=Streptomyces coryli TaxID=1128680 RepID=A0A6G4TYB8_9ACTN|nr:hypothetical protein [Streptomyces coryli]NGN64975.1 hypothetical protein [Streptomyces coryli]